MTRDQVLTEARLAVGRAKELAVYADSAAHNSDNRAKVPAFAAAGALWADVARSYAALAQAMPETETENADV